MKRLEVKELSIVDWEQTNFVLVGLRASKIRTVSVAIKVPQI